MYVIDVIPLSRTAPGILSYRSTKELPVGSIVHIMVRKSSTQGIVISSMPVLAAKEMLKHARFLLSRSVPAASGTLPPAVMRAAERTAQYHATTTGAVLAAMFSEHAQNGIELPSSAFESGREYKEVLCEFPLDERVQKYRAAIRACVGSGNAALLIAPTIPELSFWEQSFKEFDPLVLSGALPKTKRSKALEKAVGHVGLIIATPSFSWVPVEKLGGIIIDRVSSGRYVLPKRPYLSLVYAIEALARERKLPLTLGDFPLPLEYRKADSALTSKSIAPVTVIDARRPKDTPQDQNESEPWTALPKQVLETIKTEVSNGGRALVLAARKGYAPAVVCRDCGQAQTDERGMAYSFSLTGGARVFRTSDGHTTEAKRACQRCGSWNLLPLGVGIERLEEELRKEMPGANILTIPPELLTSARKVRTAVQDAQQSGTVVIGTEALLPWLYAGRQLDAREPLGVIASADSLLSQPFWRARERFVRLAYFLNGLSKEVLLVTRHPEDTAVDAVAHPDSKAFWEEERALRKALIYPPYGTILTLAIDGSQAKSALEAKRIGEQLAAHAPSFLPTRNVQGSTWRTTLVLNLLENDWPNTELNTYLRTLPPNVRVRIDPESFW